MPLFHTECDCPKYKIQSEKHDIRMSSMSTGWIWRPMVCRLTARDGKPEENLNFTPQLCVDTISSKIRHVEITALDATFQYKM